MIASLLGAALLQGIVLDAPRPDIEEGDPAPDTVFTAPAGSLQERWTWAEQTLRSHESFWVGWTVPGDPTGAQWHFIDRGVPVRIGSSVVMGNFRMSGSVGGLSFHGVSLTSVVGPRDLHETAILLRYDRRDGRTVLTRIHAGSFAFPLFFDGGALAWLGGGNDAGSIGLIRAAWGSAADDRVLRDLVSATAAHRTASAAAPALREWLANAVLPSAVRRTAADALGTHADDGAVDALRTAARSDTSASVRSAAARALARAAEPATAVAELTRIANQDEDRSVRRNAVNAIGAIGDRVAFDALVGIIETPVDTTESTTRRSALATVVAQARRRSVPASQPVLDLLARVARIDSDASVRRQAVSSLVGLRDPRVTPLLIDIARTHADAATRRTAAAGLSSAEPRTDALAALRGLAWEHESVDTQRAAVNALSRMEGDDVRTVLAELAESHPRSDIRRSSLRAVLDLDTRGSGETGGG
jgi:HEAT repeat protein